jgi:hypothetical protein
MPPIYFAAYDVHGDMPAVPPAVIESICHNKVCIKGELVTPVDDGVSLNMQLCKELDLYTSLVNSSDLHHLLDLPAFLVHQATELKDKIHAALLLPKHMERKIFNN